MAAILVLSFLSDFVYGPRLRSLEPGGPEWAALRRKTAVIGRVNAGLALVIVIAATWLFR